MQLINITSEALQATIRRLLPSQAGFSEDLQAQNVITPIIDLTPTAEGTQLPEQLRSAVSRTDLNQFNVSNSSATIADTPGFYELYTTVTIANTSGTSDTAQLTFLGSTNKNMFLIGAMNSSNGIQYIRFVFFLDTGDSLRATSTGLKALINGSVRQIADRYGNLLNPTGFTFE